MFQGLKTHYQHSGRSKWDLNEVEEAIFSRCRRPCYPFFCLLHGPTCNLVEIKEAMYKLFHYPPNSFSTSWQADIWLARPRKSDVSRSRVMPFTLIIWHLGRSKGTESIFYLLTSRKWYFRDLEKAVFQWVAWSFYSFYAFHEPKKQLVWGRESDDSCSHQALQSNVLPLSRLKMRLCRGRENDHYPV